MRKLILFIMVSLDGYFEGPNGELDWHNVDGEFNEFAIEQLNSVDILIFGRITYQIMVNYWPNVKNEDSTVAGLMNSKQKIVISKTLEKADWNNTRLIKENIPEEISKLKQQQGKDLIILGSSNLAESLTQMGLIDEYRFIINPVILGKGHSLLEGINDSHILKLQKTRIFNSGNVLLYYKPK